MRAFIGIRVKPMPEIVGLLEQIRVLKCGKTVEPENLHVNIKFLGEITEEQVRRAAEALDSLGGFGRFEMRLKKVGCFPSLQRARVVWLGVDSPELLRLQQAVDALLEKQGFGREQGFSPHVTLARIKHKNPGLEKLFEDFEEKEFGAQAAEKLCLIESKLSKTGPTYVDAHAVVL